VGGCCRRPVASSDYQTRRVWLVPVHRKPSAVGRVRLLSRLDSDQYKLPDLCRYDECKPYHSMNASSHHPSPVQVCGRERAFVASKFMCRHESGHPAAHPSPVLVCSWCRLLHHFNLNNRFPDIDRLQLTHRGLFEAVVLPAHRGALIVTRLEHSEAADCFGGFWRHTEYQYSKEPSTSSLYFTFR